MSRGNGSQCLRHAVDERLGADEAGARVHPRLGHEVLATAESDLEPHVIDRLRKQGSRRRWRSGEIEGEPRQQGLEQRRLLRPQGMAFTPAEERTRSSGLVRHDKGRPRCHAC
jgi:hypothetical protein